MAKPTISALRSLGGEKGYTVDRALMKDQWRLIDVDGELAKNPKTKAAAFSIGEAMSFLQDKPDR